MQEQIAQQVYRRASATPEELAARRTVANPHRAGYHAGIHPEDQPYLSDDVFSYQGMPRSAIRYTTINPEQEVYTQGNRRIVVHHEPPPKPPKRKRRFHWMFFVGLALFTMVVGWIAFTLLSNWWQAKQEDWKYGIPRTFQTDQFVGHGDSADNPNHFIAVNVGGTIEVVELNTTNPRADHIYVITKISDSTTPVTVSFDDSNHDGKVDLLVTIGSSYTVILLNDGTQFKQQ